MRMPTTMQNGHTGDNTHALKWLKDFLKERNQRKGLDDEDGAVPSKYIIHRYHECHESSKFEYLHRLVTHNCTDEILGILEESNDDFSKIRNFVEVTLIHLAAERNMLDVVSKLIAVGVDVNIKTNKGVTPLHFAARKDNVDCVGLLLQHSANPTAKDRFRYTPIDYAKVKAGLDCLKILEEFICDNDLEEDDGIYSGLSVEETQSHRESAMKRWNTIIIPTEQFDW